MTARLTAANWLNCLILAPLFWALLSCGQAEVPGLGNTQPEAQSAAEEQPAEQSAELNLVQDDQPSAEKAGWVTVRVLREADGALLPDVPVEIVWQVTEEEVAYLKGVTKENGECRIPVMPDTMVLQCSAMGTPLTAPISESMMKEVEVDEEYVVELTVVPAGILSGVVLDENGTPLPNAKIAVWHAIPSKTEGEEVYEPDSFGRTDVNGRFMQGGLPAGPFTISASGEGMVGYQRAGGVIQSGQLHEGLELVLGPAHEVYGRVLGPDGLPFPGGLVIAGQPGRREDVQMTEVEDVFYFPAPQIVTRVDESGQFHLSRVPDGHLWNLNIRTREFLPWFGRIQPDQDFVEAVLSTGVQISGRLLDPQGEPVGEADLRLFADRTPSTRSRSGGRFPFPAVASSADALFLAYAPGFMPVILQPDMTQDEVILAIDMLPSQAVTGTLVDSQGQPIANAPVEIAFHAPLDGAMAFLKQVPPRKRPEHVFKLTRSLTNDKGEFSFPDLYASEFKLWNSTRGKETFVLVRPGQMGVVLQID